MAEPGPLQADGERVWVRTLSAGDVAGCERAIRLSADRLRPWNPVDPAIISMRLHRQSSDVRTFVIHARDAEAARTAGHDVVGTVNVRNVVRGRAQYGDMGYDAYDPYAGTGLFAQGLRLVVDLAFADPPRGMGLHRLGASVQPANLASSGTLRSLGFRREAFNPRLVWLGDSSGQERWRDHDGYAVTREDWPARPYAAYPPRRTVVLVNGVPGSGKSTLAAALAEELAVPRLSKDELTEALAGSLEPVGAGAVQVRWAPPGEEAPNQSRVLGRAASRLMWSMLATSTPGAVVESPFWLHHARYVAAGLRAAGLDPGGVPEVWCDVPLDLARLRYEARAADRHWVHGPQGEFGQMWDWVAERASPVGLGPVIKVNAAASLSPRTVVRLALLVRAAAVADS